MKLLLSIMAVLSSATSYCQVNPGLIHSYRWYMPIVNDTIYNKLNTHSTGAAKPGIYFLPRDHMPCIVPDTKEIVKIPNAWKGATVRVYRGNIPNPAEPPIKKESNNSKSR